MKKSLVPTENIEPPKELKHFFDDPPLVGNERREDFENFFLTIATAVRPADAIEWILTRDVLIIVGNPARAPDQGRYHRAEAEGGSQRI